MLAADLICTNGNLITLDVKRPRAKAMAVRDGKIVTIGSDEEVVRCADSGTKRIDLRGKTIVPGFCDSHLHLAWYGSQLLKMADLVGSAGIDDLLARLLQIASRTSGWIQGHGFDQDKLAERRFPTRDDLDRVSSDTPIIISRVCGHAAVVNTAALKLISPSERDRGDADSGRYTENDISAFHRQIPALSEEEMEQSILLAASIALKTGITSVHTLLDTPDQMIGYARLQRAGRLPIRVVGIPQYGAIEELHRHGIRSGFGDDMLRFGGAKFFSDGSLGAHTAWLAEPYADKTATRGMRVYTPDDLKAKCLDAQARGFQLVIHAIGDQALRETLDAIEYALANDPEGRGNTYHRHRVEHASLCPADCIERMAKNRIIATLQPQFVTSDTWTADRIGPDRARYAYPFKSMIDAGVPVTLSSDCPVEKLDAFQAIASAVGRHAWSPGECLTAEEAIRAYCLGSAYAAHMDDVSGSLEAGKFADFVVLSADPTDLDAVQIASITAQRVFLAGNEIVPGVR